MTDGINTSLLSIVEDLPCALAILDRGLQYLCVSKRWLEILGLSDRDVHGVSHYDLFPGMPAPWRKVCDRALCGETVSVYEDRLGRGANGELWIEWSMLPWRDRDGLIAGIAVVARDITKRRNAEIALTESEAFLQKVVNSSPVAIVTANEKGEILSFSRSAEQIFRRHSNEVIGQNLQILMAEPDASQHAQHVQRYLETGERKIIGLSRRVTALRSDGAIFPARLHIAEFVDGVRVFVAFIEDMSDADAAERRLNDMRAQLHHAGRLSALGEMTTTIAHEINQPLTAAASLAAAASLILLKHDKSSPDRATPLIDEAVSEIRRASEIIHQMRDFAKKRRTTRSLNEINKVVEDAGAIGLIGAAGDGVEIEYNLGADVGSANIDRLQIQQVLANLIRNAVDAMHDAPVKRITITTAKSNGHIEISVADTGHGIEPAVRARLFEPFVTSKEDGLGIGLSITKSIIDAHQGEIIALDNDQKGTIFRVRLPI